LLFLTRLRRTLPFKELGYLYGCGKTTAKRWYGEILDLFCDVIVQNVFYPRSPDELRQMRSDLTKVRFADLLAAIDATNWPMLKPENFLLNRLTYSAYKNYNALQVVMCKSDQQSGVSGSF
jgi:hypothetical protein